MSARMRPISQVELEQQLDISKSALEQAMSYDEKEEYSKALLLYKKGLTLTDRALSMNTPAHLQPIVDKLRIYKSMYQERIAILSQTKEKTWGGMISSTFSNWFNPQPEPPKRKVHKTQPKHHQSVASSSTTFSKQQHQQPKPKFSNNNATPKFNLSRSQHQQPKPKFSNNNDTPKFVMSKSKTTTTKDKMRKLKNSPHMRGLENELVTTILNDVVVDDTKITFDDIAGLNNVKQLLMEVIIWPAQRPDIFKGLLKPPRGVLLFGPPGTGKTMIAQAVAGQCDATFFSISASSLSSKWHGEGEKLVKTLFALARGLSPSIIFIDEIDSMLSKRSDKEHEASRRMKTEFFVQMQGIQSYEGFQDSVLVIGATNLPSDLDSAALRRFERRVMVPLPDPEARRGLFKHLLSKVKSKLSSSDLDTIITKTKRYSCADLTQLCTEAAFFPLRDNKRPLMDVRERDIRPVLLSDFERAMEIVKPSTNIKDIKELKAWNKEYGSTAKK